MAEAGLALPKLPPLAEDEAFLVWWHVLRPDRLHIADEVERTARDYRRHEAYEASEALSVIARWLRASAGEVFGDGASLNGGSDSGVDDAPDQKSEPAEQAPIGTTAKYGALPDGR